MTMKCVKKLADGVISRMTDKEARAIVSKMPESFAYAPKNEWKAQSKTVAGRRKFYKKGGR